MVDITPYHTILLGYEYYGNKRGVLEVGRCVSGDKDTAASDEGDIFGSEGISIRLGASVLPRKEEEQKFTYDNSAFILEYGVT